MKGTRSERRALGLGLALAFAGWVGGEVVQADDQDIPRLIARPVAARPLSVTEPVAVNETMAIRAESSLRRDDAVRQTSLQEGELQWQRRAGSEMSTFNAPRTGASPRVAAHDPIEDPFGDRAGAALAPANDYQPVAPRRMAPRGNFAAPVSDRRFRQDEPRPAPFDCQTFYDNLLNDRLDLIDLTISPSGNPEAETPEEYRAGVSRKMSDAKPMDWIDRHGQVIARGRMQDWVNGRVLILTDDGRSASVVYDDLSAATRNIVSDLWEVPSECGLPEAGSVDRMWAFQTYTWTASALCHKPLFFEDVQLERYGQTSRPLIQPFKSGAHFFLNIAAMPYNAGVYPPNECRYSLGYYRPGDCAPYLGKTLPLSARGALFQAGAVVGAAVTLP